MKKVVLMLVSVLTLMSCAPEDKTKTELKNKIGELSLDAGKSSVAIDYEIQSYKVIDSTMSKKRLLWDAEFDLFLYEDSRDDAITMSQPPFNKGKDSLEYKVSLYEEKIKEVEAEIRELEAEINVATDDEPMDLKYSVVIEYYDPILKVDATQEKTVTINGNLNRDPYINL